MIRFVPITAKPPKNQNRSSEKEILMNRCEAFRSILHVSVYSHYLVQTNVPLSFCAYKKKTEGVTAFWTDPFFAERLYWIQHFDRLK